MDIQENEEKMFEVPTHEEERVDEEGVVVPRRRNRVLTSNRLVNSIDAALDPSKNEFSFNSF